jgi:hypothetical protein
MAALKQSGFSSTNFTTPRESDKNVTKVGEHSSHLSHVFIEKSIDLITVV